MDTLDTMYKRLKDARERLGYSQEFVAERLNINRPAVVNIESGQRKVSAEELGQFSRLYKISMEELLYGQTTPEGDLSIFGQQFLKLNESDRKEVLHIIEMKNNPPQHEVVYDNEYLDGGRDCKGQYYIDYDGKKYYIEDNEEAVEVHDPNKDYFEKNKEPKVATSEDNSLIVKLNDLTTSDKHFLKISKHIDYSKLNDAIGAFLCNQNVFYPDLSTTTDELKPAPPFDIDEVIDLIDKLGKYSLRYALMINEIIIRSLAADISFKDGLYYYVLSQYKHLEQYPNDVDYTELRLFRDWARSKHLFDIEYKKDNINQTEDLKTFFVKLSSGKGSELPDIDK